MLRVGFVECVGGCAWWCLVCGFMSVCDVCVVYVVSVVCTVVMLVSVCMVCVCCVYSWMMVSGLCDECVVCDRVYV